MTENARPFKVEFPKEYRGILSESGGEFVEWSGRSTTKTTSNEIAIINAMLKSKLNNIWYCRAEKTDIGSTVFSSLLSTIQMMNYEKYFTVSKSPYQVTCKTTGAVCYFSGINGKTDDDVSETKGFTPNNKTLAYCILDEADQTKHPNHITGWETTLNKFLLPHGKVIFAANPPINKAHWSNKFFNDKIKNGAERIFLTWKNVERLLNPRTVEAIKKMQRDDPDFYRYWYLGEPASFKGLVYPQFNRQKHVINIFKYLAERPNIFCKELVLGLDEGTVNDSTCITPMAILSNGVGVVLDMKEIDPLVDGQKAITEVCRIMIEWLKDLLLKFPFLKYAKRSWIFECAEGGQQLRLQFTEMTGENTFNVEKKSIMGDVRRVRSMLQEEVLLFHTAPNVTTEILMTDIENYVFDEKTGEIKKQQRDDSIDSLEYATKLYYDAPYAFNDESASVLMRY